MTLQPPIPFINVPALAGHVDLCAGQVAVEASPIMAASYDRRGMEDFFTACGLRYLQHPEFLDDSARRDTETVRQRYECLRSTHGRIRPSSPEAGRALHELLEAHRERFPEIDEGRIADLCIGFIGGEIGFGCFARSAISAGAYLGEYTGRISPLDLIRLGNVYIKTANPWYQHFLGFLEEPIPPLMIDAQLAGNEFRYVNHIASGLLLANGGTAVNARNETVFYNGSFRVVLRAARDIQAGEELRTDYGTAFLQYLGIQLDNSQVYRIVDGKVVSCPISQPRG